MTQKNYRVVLSGRVFTEVDMYADDEAQAMRLAEEWARGKTQPEQVNAIDFDGDAWMADEAEEAS